MRKITSKLITLSLVATTLLSGATSSETKLTDFLKSRYSSNPNIKELKIDVVDSATIPNSKNMWKGIKLNLSGQFNKAGKYVPFSENQIFFTDGENFTDSLTALDGTDWKTLFVPKPELKHYSATHLIHGNLNAKHKILIFSDPLCPYCQRSIPPLLDYVKKYPKTFAVFYYHLPLERIHPAAVQLTKLMYMAQIRGDKDAIGTAYHTPVSSKETSDEKILEAFNRATGLKYTMADLNSPLATRALLKDKEVASELEVRGTPTVYLDGVKTGGEFYKSIEIVDNK